MSRGRCLAPISAVALASLLLCPVTVACAPTPLAPHLSLSLASPDLSTDPSSPLVQHFADEVGRISQGTVEIVPHWDVTPPGTSGWNQEVAARVADGDYDLGLVESRAFDELDVTSLQALTVPLLIQSEALLHSVLEGPLREQLMAGLPAAGVVGVDLFPAEFMHPFGFDAPLLGAGDYRGEVIHAADSRAARMQFAALGARVTDDEVGIAQMRGQESGYAWAVTGIATGNVIFAPRVDVLVVDADVRERLRPDQWELLKAAAANTRAWAFDNLPSDLESAAAFCRAGGQIVAASAAQLRELEDIFEAMSAELRSADDYTARMLDAVAALRALHPESDQVTTCPALEELPDANQTSALNGVYRFDASADALRAEGVGEKLVGMNAGTYTVTTKDGRWSATQVYETGRDRGTTWHGNGSYAVGDGVMTFYWPVGFEADWSRATVTIEGDGSLRFSNLVEAHGGEWTLMDRVVFAHWERIGDAR